jgi:hypothetical protein
MKTVKIDIIWLIVGLIVLFTVIKSCESEPRTITKTETVVKWKTDTIKETEIKEVQKPVYVEKIKTVKGKDSIIYVDKPSKTSQTAKIYKTELKSDSATANLNITSLGRVLDVKGSITYPSIKKTVETTIIKNKSGFYIYGQLPVNDLANPEIGIQYNIRNTIFLSSGVQYNNFTKKPDINVGIGIKIF